MREPVEVVRDVDVEREIRAADHSECGADPACLGGVTTERAFAVRELERQRDRERADVRAVVPMTRNESHDRSVTVVGEGDERLVLGADRRGRPRSARIRANGGGRGPQQPLRSSPPPGSSTTSAPTSRAQPRTSGAAVTTTTGSGYAASTTRIAQLADEIGTTRFGEALGETQLRVDERPDRDDHSGARHVAAYATGVEPVYSLARAALLPPVRFGMRWTFEGAHRVPTYGPAILASNHISYLDPLVLAHLADRRHRRVRFLAKAELFEKRGLGWSLRQIGQIPVQRNSDEAASSLDEAVAALGRGECIAVFPEGTISLDLEPMAAKTGVARLAAA